MAVTVAGLTFYPLYVVHHDCWRVLLPSGGGGFDAHNHYGHSHFFMLGYDWQNADQDAFHGQMNFKFELQDIWGPRSGDPNQQFQYRVVGTPKWYFHIEEIWRRVYVQPWDDPTNDPDNPSSVGRRGIKWDASQPLQTFGPFREGRDFTPYFLHSARTLPIEYFKNESRDRTARDNFVKQQWAAQPPGTTRFPYTDTLYDPPEDGATPIYRTPGGLKTFPDGLYVYPTLEYQKVKQLDWERLPGFQAKNDKSPTDFGDGWEVEVQIPMKDLTTGEYRSPFAPRKGVVSPPGSYHNNLVASASQLKFRARDYVPEPDDTEEGSYDYENRPFGMSAANAGQPLTFQNPYPGQADGRWVQQCIGGIVRAKAEVVLESKLNNAGPAGYQSVFVFTTQYIPADKFAGTDQLEGSAS